MPYPCNAKESEKHFSSLFSRSTPMVNGVYSGLRLVIHQRFVEIRSVIFCMKLTKTKQTTNKGTQVLAEI